MTAIAFDIPAEIQQITRGLERFLHAEVIARHDKHAELLDDPRRRYGADGRYAPEVVELIRQVHNTLRIINIADGTNEILCRTIYQQLAKGELEL